MRMRQTMVLAVLLAGAPLAACGGKSVSVGPGRPMDAATARQQITTNSRRMMEGFQRRDGRAVAEFYVPDAQLVFPDGRSARGQQAIADSLNAWFRVSSQQYRNYRIEWDVRDIRVAESGELAVESGRFTETWDGGRRGGPYVVVWAYDQARLWKIITDIANDP